MASSIPPARREENLDLDSTVERFKKMFSVSKLLHRCNAAKLKGIAVVQIFIYLLSLAFRNRSMFMDMRSGSCPVDMSKNTVYRLLNDGRVNWERFERELAGLAIKTLEPLTDADRKLAFVVDDTLYKRDRAKKSELLSRVYDHNDHRYYNGYRMLTLGWNDGNTFIPIQACMLGSGNDENLVGPVESRDGRTLAAKRRALAREKATDVTVKMVHDATTSGISAQYVLFDSWFFSPSMAKRLLEDEKLHVAAMCRKSSKIYFQIGTGDSARQLNVKQIYAENKKRRGRSKYLLAVEAFIPGTNGRIPVRLVFVRNRNKKKDWLVLVTTDMNLTPEEVIQLYGRRWSILREGFGFPNDFRGVRQRSRLSSLPCCKYAGNLKHSKILNSCMPYSGW